MDEDCLKRLWYECVARDGFCVQLRVDLKWDNDAFDRLTEAMRCICKHYELVSAVELKQSYERNQRRNEERRARGEPILTPRTSQDEIEKLKDPPLPETRRMLPDWLAEQFWWLPEEIIGWTSHEAWKKKIAEKPKYFEKAYLRLRMLSSWFFTGYCPWMDEEGGWAATFLE